MSTSKLKSYPTWKQLKQEFEDRYITSCEVKLEGCTGTWWLTPAHFRKRIEYKSQPEILWTFPEVVLACINCHQKMERDKELTKQVFAKLRKGIDKLS